MNSEGFIHLVRVMIFIEAAKHSQFVGRFYILTLKTFLTIHYKSTLLSMLDSIDNVTLYKFSNK